jgi:hypothetical protein
MANGTHPFHDQVTRHGQGGPSDPTAVTHQLTRMTSTHQVFDIYLPTALWTFGALGTFVQRILHVCPGATIYEGAVGVWQGHGESTRILRVSVEVVDAHGRQIFDVNNLRTGVRDAATGLLIDLQSHHGHVEQAIFFNDWPACGTLVTR